MLQTVRVTIITLHIHFLSFTFIEPSCFMKTFHDFMFTIITPDQCLTFQNVFMDKCGENPHLFFGWFELFRFNHQLLFCTHVLLGKAVKRGF